MRTEAQPALADPSDQHGPLDFFRDLHAALGSTWDARSTQPEQQIPAVLSQAWECFDANVAIQSEGQPAVACHKGCATCCTLRVSATAPEVWLAARFIEATAPAFAQAGIDLKARLRQADAATRGLDETQRVALRQRCPFIVQGACAIYRVRPLACRGHASHDKRACVDAARGVRDEVPFSGPHRMVRSLVQCALQSVLRDRRLAWGAYEFNQALCLSLDDPQALAQWQQGADPLASAAVEDSAERADMAAALDAALAG